MRRGPSYLCTQQFRFAQYPMSHARSRGTRVKNGRLTLHVAECIIAAILNQIPLKNAELNNQTFT